MSRQINNPTRDEIWESIRRGVETGTIKDYQSAVRAASALRAAFLVIYSDRFEALPITDSEDSQEEQEREDRKRRLLEIEQLAKPLEFESPKGPSAP